MTGGRWAGAQAARRGRAHAERTPNILAMSVTLDVSKLSGWLNIPVFCRKSKGGGIRNCIAELCARCGSGDGRAWGGGGASSPQGRARLVGNWAQGTGEAHPEHAAHVCDLGRVKTQRLVECRRILPSPQKGGYGAG